SPRDPPATTHSHCTSVAYARPTPGPAPFPYTTLFRSSLADGDYLFHAVVTDPAGNTSTSNAIEVVVDNTNPTAGTLAFTGLDDKIRRAHVSTPVTSSSRLQPTATTNTNGTSVPYAVST